MRSRGWLYVSMLVLLVTGTHLMLIDEVHLGFMNFGNLWGIVMPVKHILPAGMVGMGFWYNFILRVGPLMSSNTGAAQAIERFRWRVNAMAVCGVLVLLLTALARAE